MTSANHPPTDLSLEAILTTMFDRQSKLMVKFQEIEQLPSPPLALHTPNAQRIMRDFAWRYTEELCEMFEEYRLSDHEPNWLIELSDATHFMIEMLIFAGISPRQCVNALRNEWPTRNPAITVSQTLWLATHNLGQAMHALPHKPWKKTMGPTNELEFRQKMLESFVGFCKVWGQISQSEQDFFRYYMEKSLIVKKRQEEGY